MWFFTDLSDNMLIHIKLPKSTLQEIMGVLQLCLNWSFWFNFFHNYRRQRRKWWMHFRNLRIILNIYSLLKPYFFKVWAVIFLERSVKWSHSSELIVMPGQSNWAWSILTILIHFKLRAWKLVRPWALRLLFEHQWYGMKLVCLLYSLALPGFFLSLNLFD